VTDFSDAVNVPSHDAWGPMTGYLYQALTGLLILMQKRDVQGQIAIEHFDDIVFQGDCSALEAIQTKHHVLRGGDLSDRSVDLWRSINSWVDSIKSKKLSLTSSFVLMTTTVAKKDTIAFLLKRGADRDPSVALQKLNQICEKCTVSSINNYCANFASLSVEEKTALINNLFILDACVAAAGLKEAIIKEIVFFVPSNHQDDIYYALIGWWFSMVIEKLTSDDGPFISGLALQKQVSFIMRSYTPASLPIDVLDTLNPTNEEKEKISPERIILLKQLKLIAASDTHVRNCLQDFYHAYVQISRWSRNQDVGSDELTKYQQKLIDEWSVRFIQMDESLAGENSNCSELEKQKEGRELLDEIEKLDLRIRSEVDDHFVMRGIYYMLSGDLKVGWHVDFMNRLCDLLEKADGK